MQFDATVPVITDRVHQARVVNALEPEWEARFEPKSYGFRPGRGCHDAIEAIFHVAKQNPRRLWVLDADLAGAFDRIGHDHILTMLGTFPARGMIRQWLKAGVVEQGRLSRTEEGTPQGGVASPLLLNIALHGMEYAAGASYGADQRAKKGSPVLIRYADDFVVHCHTRQEALEVKARLAEWLAPRGLAFNDDKTNVVSLDEGFDFLGFNVRRYHGKLLIKPSKAAIRRIRKRLRDELRSLRGSNAQAVIRRLNPIIRGWANYYRTQVSAEAFGKLDYYLWQLTLKWAKFNHSTKPTYWVIARYFGKFNKARQDRSVFGNRTSGAFLHRFAWTNIVRHPIVKHAASPDDPELADYWAWRRAKRPCRSTAPPSGSIGSRTDAARSARPRSSPPQNAHKPHATGSTGWPPLARRSTSSGTQPHRKGRTPSHPPPLQPHRQPPSLLEPDARQLGTSGL